MASISKRKNVWVVTVSTGYDENRKQLRSYTSFPLSYSKQEVKILAAKFEEECRSNKTGVVNRNYTLNQLIDYWQKHEGYRHAQTTKARNAGLLARIRPSIGHIKLGKLAPKHILSFLEALRDSPRLDSRKGGLSGRSIYMHYSLVKSILNKAKKWQIINSNPCDFVDPPKYKTDRIAIWQEDDLKRFMELLLEKAPEHHKIFFLLAFTAGLRRSELCGIRLSQIDLKNNTVLINNVTVYAAGKTYQKEPKTDSSMAKVPIVPAVREHLISYIRDLKSINGDSVEYLFTNLDGKQYHPDIFKTWLTRFCKANNLPIVTVHAFRHMAVTYALQKGYDIKHVSQFARHSKVSTTANIYAELISNTSSALANDLGEFIKSTAK